LDGTHDLTSLQMCTLQHGHCEEAIRPDSEPILPTRWFTRLSAVKSVLKNYSYTLDALYKAYRKQQQTVK